jgi:hypothetical protein
MEISGECRILQNEKLRNLYYLLKDGKSIKQSVYVELKRD